MGEYSHFSHLSETLQPQSAIHHLLLHMYAAQDVSLSWWAMARELSGKHPCTSSSSKSVPNLACLWSLRGNILFSHGLQRHRENAKEKERHWPADIFIEASRIYCIPPSPRLSTLTVENQQFRTRNIETVQEAQQGNKEYISFLITTISYLKLRNVWNCIYVFPSMEFVLYCVCDKNDFPIIIYFPIHINIHTLA